MRKLRDTLRVPIQCPNCPEVTEKPLAWLVDMNSLFCPACGNGIDLQTKELNTLLKRLDQVCTDADKVAAVTR